MKADELRALMNFYHDIFVQYNNEHEEQLSNETVDDLMDLLYRHVRAAMVV